ncbi:hypothetical protein MPSEU_000358500 [Mayamaea pseudoterrestris]|nr:hypothetical protein MPSEU_000358500 [Mayamaea pseudoterrestris]
MSTNNPVAKIVVIGAGWWSQGWHIPQLARNPRVELVAIVDSGLPKNKSDEEKENDKNDKNEKTELLSLQELQEKYNTQTFSSVDDLMEAQLDFDGMIIGTPHATHYQLAKRFIGKYHLLLEKPMTTDVHEAMELCRLVKEQQQQTNEGDGSSSPSIKQVFLNHTANYRSQAMAAREAVADCVGTIKHVSISMAAALTFLFEDPQQTTWTQTSDNMLGNGFGWGQLAHPLAWIVYVCPTLQPIKVLACGMVHSATSGADVSVAATILWKYCEQSEDNDGDTNEHTDDNNNNFVTMSLTGTCLLPGNEHSDPPVGKLLDFQIYGDHGAVLYGGDTSDTKSGKLQVRRMETDGKVEIPRGMDELGFEFENCAQDGDGPESMQNFLDACQFESGYHVAADVTVGLKTVQVIEAMYRSNKSGRPEDVIH